MHCKGQFSVQTSTEESQVGLSDEKHYECHRNTSVHFPSPPSLVHPIHTPYTCIVMHIVLTCSHRVIFSVKHSLNNVILLPSSVTASLNDVTLSPNYIARSPCHSLYHHVTHQEVHNLLQPLRVHGPPNKGITVLFDQEEGHRIERQGHTVTCNKHTDMHTCRQALYYHT